MTAIADDRAAEARDLSDGERLLHMIHSVGGLIATTTMHVRGPLTEALLRRALDWLQRRHGILRAHIRWRGYGFSRKFPNIHRRLVFETEGTTGIPLTMTRDWRELRRQLRTPIFKRQARTCR